jgi:hypothetical protein
MTNSLKNKISIVIHNNKKKKGRRNNKKKQSNGNSSSSSHPSIVSINHSNPIQAAPSAPYAPIQAPIHNPGYNNPLFDRINEPAPQPGINLEPQFINRPPSPVYKGVIKPEPVYKGAIKAEPVPTYKPVYVKPEPEYLYPIPVVKRETLKRQPRRVAFDDGSFEHNISLTDDDTSSSYIHRMLDNGDDNSHDELHTSLIPHDEEEVEHKANDEEVEHKANDDDLPQTSRIKPRRSVRGYFKSLLTPTPKKIVPTTRRAQTGLKANGEPDMRTTLGRALAAARKKEGKSEIFEV